MYKAYRQDIYPPPVGVYEVMAGDSLSSIAEQFSIDW
jgi:LysM repeat protein